MTLKILYCLLLIIFLSTNVYSRNKHFISPVDFGINKTKTGIETYKLLFEIHTIAKSLGLPVIYKGIKNIDIEIPPNAESIPLSTYTDFSDVNISVLNNSKHFFLFSLCDTMKQIVVSAHSIDEGRFYQQDLNNGTYLLSIKDRKAWVPERNGYGSPFTRRDILFIENGHSKNKVISPYNNKQSDPCCKFVPVSSTKKTIKNLHFYRDSSSQNITFLFNITSQYNVAIENISINTPVNSSLYGDACIKIYDSYKVKLKNVNISGTYSLPQKYGYGINMNNISDFEVDNLNATAKWGIFGNNNISNVIVKNSTLNRFDIHCYGKDIKCTNCNFKDLYNQYSSIYGFIKYLNCTFDHCVPVLLEPSYNAYTSFNLIIKNCSFIISKDKNYVVYAKKAVKGNNERKELESINWPNISINSLRIINNENAEDFFLFYNDRSYVDKPLRGFLNIFLNDIYYSSTSTEGKLLFKLYSQPITVDNKVNFNCGKVSNHIDVISDN